MHCYLHDVLQHCLCVQVYKLRAADAKERQSWVSSLRSEIERCNTAHSGYVKTQVSAMRCYIVPVQ